MNVKDIITLSTGKTMYFSLKIRFSKSYPLFTRQQFYNIFHDFDNMYKCNSMYKFTERQSG